jgi:hypothetical protein
MTQPIPDPPSAAAHAEHAELCRDIVADLLEAQDYLVTIGLTVAGLDRLGSDADGETVMEEYRQLRAAAERVTWVNHEFDLQLAEHTRRFQP